MSIAIPQLTKNLNHSVNGMLTERRMNDRDMPVTIQVIEWQLSFILYIFSDLLSGVVPQTGRVQGVALYGIRPRELLTFVQDLQTAQENPAVNGAHRHLHLSEQRGSH